VRLADALRERARVAPARPGLLVNPMRAQSLRIVPALNISSDEVDLAPAMLGEAIAG